MTDPAGHPSASCTYPFTLLTSGGGAAILRCCPKKGRPPRYLCGPLCPRAANLIHPKEPRRLQVAQGCKNPAVLLLSLFHKYRLNPSEAPRAGNAARAGVRSGPPRPCRPTVGSREAVGPAGGCLCHGRQGPAPGASHPQDRL